MPRKITISVGLLLIIFCTGLYYLGYKSGFYDAKEEIKGEVIQDKKTLETHGKEIEIIRTEPDSSANARLRKNLRTN